MSKIVKLRKSGHSAIITITKDLLDQLNWNIGDFVEVSLKSDGSTYLEVRKVKYVEA